MRTKAWGSVAIVVAICAFVLVMVVVDFAHSAILLALTAVLVGVASVLARLMGRQTREQNGYVGASTTTPSTSRSPRAASVLKIAVAIILCLGIAAAISGFVLGLSVIDWLVAVPIIISAFAWGALSRWRRLKRGAL